MHGVVLPLDWEVKCLSYRLEKSLDIPKLLEMYNQNVITGERDFISNMFVGMLPEDKRPSACIGCGACVAACPNGSASLFLGAKITHLGELPQGQAERDLRVVNMVGQHDAEGFGGCTNIG